MTEICYEPIGYFSCSQTNPTDSPRQGVLAQESSGFIHLEKKYGSDCLRDLQGMERVWLIYDFHHNKSWKPLVRPPRGANQKRGVFATRSPYRPNSIGMSCVKLGELSGDLVQILEHDLLDGTPILDIKPYLPYSDSFQNSRVGWLENLKKYEVNWSESVLEQLSWLEEHMPINFKDIIRNQLEFEPTNKKIKRVREKGDHYILAYRTWRILFSVDDPYIRIKKIVSGYNSDEIMNDLDPYADKVLHRKFIKKFLCLAK